MQQNARHIVSMILMCVVVGIFIILGLFFTLIFVFVWGILELLLQFAPKETKGKGKIVSNGQIISVDYKVIEETEMPHSEETKKNNSKE
jgi:hypothetical protein